ncbi:endolytic transglycosylase MltG [Aeromicrobium sp. 636]|uniref:Endolytic murein transglycosylase n=1 Tax=Aeromicrobium senzhongii TaxID=2663859 RepID=A0A8I0K233_9ACTN|nr:MULTISPECIES: endolytic transglycosylase MltG [Aeromicrobium]MBC9225280.1 endolytic transglycosylase MltG [Aeromicrobium senzhongii]MCQ3997390.1 endolytic transglycosylase MltG [Aeromicrobium sp. 636]
MSGGDGGLTMLTGPEEPRPSRPGSRRKAEPPAKKKSGLKNIIALIAVAAILVGGYVVVTKVMDRMGGADDYSGSGTGTVEVTIPSGASGIDIARILAKDDVVKSSEAFYQLSLSDSRAQQVQPGTYRLRKQMSAEAALTVLVDPSARIQAKFTVPEGARVGQIVEIISKNTELKAEDLEAALDDPATIGLPDYANGNPEGYLYPETYFVEPGDDAKAVLSRMVKQTLKVAKDLDIGSRAPALGLSGEEVLTVASILEYEGQKDEDYAKIARVLYNRIEQGMPLQLDSTVSYVSERKGDVWTTAEERANPSLYNTYQHAGLPPGPIGSPGEASIQAALNPAQGPWLYFFATKDGSVIYNEDFGKHTRDCQAEYGAGSCGG